jgi:hypothetical protein
MPSLMRLLRRPAPLLLLFVLMAYGCGKGYQPVRGTVTFEDGKPVPGGMIVFESLGEEHPITARGEIQPDGSFELGTDNPEDGVRPGKYQVLVTQRVENPDAVVPLPFDSRYTSFKTSGLEFEVKSGVNQYPIKLARAPKSRR